MLFALTVVTAGAAWLVGFALYHWLHDPPLGPSWWVDLVEETHQPGLEIGALAGENRAGLNTRAVVEHHRIDILDRRRLEKRACSCYRTIRNAYSQLLPMTYR